MKTKAVRLYGKNDLRMEEFELPKIKDNEILAKVVSDSICMSSFKAQDQGAKHKRVPDDVADNPVIIGHECCGELVEVGAKWASKFKAGDRYTIQPALNYKGSMDSPGYSYKYIGGGATYIIIPEEVMLLDCLLPYEGESYFMGSLAEPMSCIVGAMHANYHVQPGKYVHEMGIVDGGKMAILAGVGPMGLGFIDYAIHCDRKPGLLVVTDIDSSRLKRAASIFTVEEAKKNGVELIYLNTSNINNPVKKLTELSGETGFDDVFVMTPVQPLIEQGDAILGKDGCLNFFAGPSNTDFEVSINFYDVHYAGHHIIGTTGGNTDDMRESLDMATKGLINPAAMVTHVGGLDSVAETTIKLPEIPGGKKLVYTEISMEMTAIEDFKIKGEKSNLFKNLAEICDRHNGLWSPEAERYLLANGKKI